MFNGRVMLSGAALCGVLLLWLTFGRAHAAWSNEHTAVQVRSDCPPTPVRVQLESRLASLSAALELLSGALDSSRRLEARALFRDARRLYKGSEFLITYYAPALAESLNGEGDADDPDTPPQPLGRREGFGVVEQTLFGDSTGNGYDKARLATRQMLRKLASFRSATRLLDISDTATLDAVRLELARVATIGVAGYDSDESGDAIRESAAALNGMSEAVGALQSGRDGNASNAPTVAVLRAAAHTLQAHPSFKELDRFAFIVHYVTPAAKAVARLRRSLDAQPAAARRLWRPTAATPFDSDAFDVSALTPEYAPAASPQLVALGARLFADPNLSGERTRSCASCHQPTKAFTDGGIRATPLRSSHPSSLRNTPTLINAALQQTMFADQRSGFVEDQIRVVLTSRSEMAASPELAATRIAADTSYRALVRQASSGPVDERLVRVALAAYVRSLVALDAPFDRAIRGDTAAITPSARRGFNLFVGRARCGTCHFAPTFGGTLPPDFVRSEPEIIGVPGTPVLRHARVDADSGRAAVDGALVHRSAFRVPSVRNVALTAPYMHNGVYRTLEQVMDFYDRGGGAGIGESLPLQTLPPRPLRLTAADRSDLIAFLRSLTDIGIVVAKP